ncbi:hypothetical protein V6N11_001007 [Hibiscus sabdariffa]|uniref:S1-like domain-containing protein n=1 Tax=Hibiscus sabdariffa TaxID=183260 RepID=A0ABR2RYQ5_9ROSI
MHKKIWIATDDRILVDLRDYQDEKADVILKYMPNEARLLKTYDELSENTRLHEGIVDDEEDESGVDDYVEFEDEDINKIYGHAQDHGHSCESDKHILQSTIDSPSTSNTERPLPKNAEEA